MNLSLLWVFASFGTAGLWLMKHSEKEALRQEVDNLKSSMLELLEDQEKERVKSLGQSQILQNVITAIPYRIFWKDRNLIYLGCNENFAKDAGAGSSQNIVGKTDFDLNWEKVAAEFNRKCDREVMENDKPLLNIEEPKYQADGKEAVLLTSKVPLHDSSGYVIGILGVYTDITSQKKMERIVQQSEKMSAIGQLAAGVAHEINNPLGVILGFSQNITKRIKPGDPFEMPVKSIEREAIRCKNLVQDLLTFSRVSKTEKEPVDLTEAVESALSLVLAQAKVKNIELVKEFSQIPNIGADKNQIQQIVINLSNNAIDAMPKGGRLTIRLHKAKIENQEGGEIQVEDTGEGIPRDVQSKIFNPFFTTKEVGKGTGLGLSLVYEIVSKHKGKIFLESEIGKGTVFHVFLPFSS